MDLFKHIKTNYYNIILHVVIVLLGIEVYMLSMKVKLLTGGNDGEVIQIAEGDKFSFGELQFVQLPFTVDTSKQINIFIFTTKCPFCQANIQKWNAIDSIGRKNKRYESIGVWLDRESDIKAFIEKYKPKFPITVPKDPNIYKRINRLSAVPVTIIRNANLQISHLWIGKLTEQNIADINSINSANK